ncbi:MULTISPECIES: DM13 domain-containing protein [unclassified Microbacterium]|uniref:DM13 domain-containing protein n=1 Tax=unclassified Microbacterium TaxID=2609290 RepID=UPI002468BEDB|nr:MULTISPECIES: DM13 domain-containing protein [unclassified Microbacterium]MDH5132363.1 DM13 domain-containing protein [Microbacterium sp. RD10]MDH5136985.1 DM13 domain-containing protein [Microbacterium sp. RD11]MDH5146711.1 DM13 domain-containing protein [Microbacterium sp. RD12]MDH5154291.1 DM13 domain-containing protein [Microbacterium sp. RD06]MDH5166673.1 DM13 domain-containing protein [Microbacterium sp. RD02]
MRKTLLATTAALGLALALAACSPQDSGASSAPSSSSSQSTTKSSASTDTAARTGEFAGLNGKKVAGTVSVSDAEVMLSEFSSDEGPDLHVYLADGTDEAAIAAGMLVDAVSYDTATQTFTLDGVDAEDYSHVVIYCDKAKAVFGAAELS